MSENIARIVPVLDRLGIQIGQSEQAFHVPLDHLGLDSLGVYDLAMACEEEFDINVVDEDLENIKTIGQFADLVANKVNGK